MMVEGVSIRAIFRMTGASKNTIVKLLADAGEAFSDYQDRTMQGLTCKRLRVDEIWAFVYAKAKNVGTAKAAPEGAGDCWTWMAIDAETKLFPSYYMDARDVHAAQMFIGNLVLAPRQPGATYQRRIQARSGARQHQLRRAGQPRAADGMAQVYATH